MCSSPESFLIYGSIGVCRVLSIDQRQDYVNGVKQNRLYYQLKPCIRWVRSTRRWTMIRW